MGTGYTKFANESFMDEMAEVAGMDPLEFRIAHCEGNPRGAAALKRVGEMSGWGKPREDGSALGVALTDLHGAIAACVAEVKLDAESGKVSVSRVWVCGDPGIAVSPKNTRAGSLRHSPHPPLSRDSGARRSGDRSGLVRLYCSSES